jgi:hypothetical protein
MVKFSKQMELQLVPEWRHKFCDYWQLKKEIRKLKTSLAEEEEEEESARNKSHDVPLPPPPQQQQHKDIIKVTNQTNKQALETDMDTYIHVYIRIYIYTCVLATLQR